MCTYYRYDHLAKVLSRILSERPDNIPDIFEDISKDLKKTKYIPERDTLRDKTDVSPEVAIAEIQRNLFVCNISLKFVILFLKIVFFSEPQLMRVMEKM